MKNVDYYYVDKLLKFTWCEGNSNKYDVSDKDGSGAMISGKNDKKEDVFP